MALTAKETEIGRSSDKFHCDQSVFDDIDAAPADGSLVVCIREQFVIILCQFRPVVRYGSIISKCRERLIPPRIALKLVFHIQMTPNYHFRPLI